MYIYVLCQKKVNTHVCHRKGNTCADNYNYTHVDNIILGICVHTCVCTQIQKKVDTRVRGKGYTCAGNYMLFKEERVAHVC